MQIRREVAKPADREVAREEAECINKMKGELSELQKTVAWGLIVFSLVVMILAAFTQLPPPPGVNEARVQHVLAYGLVLASASPTVMQFFCMLLYRFGALLKATNHAAFSRRQSCGPLVRGEEGMPTLGIDYTSLNLSPPEYQ